VVTRRVHQVVVGASPGDAVFDQALLIRDALVSWGYDSEIYACHLHPSLERLIPHYTRYRASPDDLVIFHYSLGSELSAFVRGLRCQVVMIYHNVTPPEYLASVSQELARLAEQGRRELPEFRDQVVLALADSEFNLLDLRAAGYTNTGVLPIVLDESLYEIEPNPDLMSRYEDGAVNLLFVGRIAPNKRHDELLKVFYYYHKAFEPNSRLFLVGKAPDPAKRYLDQLQGMVRYLGLEDSVVFSGHVSFQDMVSYYKLANVFVCMSEHEGFGKPLIESMYFGLPIVAYAATAVPYTLGDAGVLVHDRDHPFIAALVDELVTDATLRNRIIAGQQERFQIYRQAAMLSSLRQYLASLLPELA